MFIDKMCKRHPEWKIKFDPLVLLSVVHSMMDDIWRYKVYHLKNSGGLSNAVKRATYMTKWIVRCKPIYIARPLDEETFKNEFDENDSTLLFNEVFAIFLSLNTINTETSELPNSKKIALTPEMMAKFLYDLQYRNLNEDALLSFYQIIYDRSMGQDFIVT